MDTTAASANKVTSVVASSNNPVLGAIITVTTTGNTGTIGSSNIFYYSPATYFDWPATSFRLYSTNITFASGGSAANQLLVPVAAAYAMLASFLLATRFVADDQGCSRQAAGVYGLLSSQRGRIAPGRRSQCLHRFRDTGR